MDGDVCDEPLTREKIKIGCLDTSLSFVFRAPAERSLAPTGVFLVPREVHEDSTNSFYIRPSTVTYIKLLNLP